MRQAIFLFLFMITVVFSCAQQKKEETTDKETAEKISNTPAKSGLSYETLTQFFQTNLTTGKGGGYDFKATLFGIRQLFSKDSLNASAIYLKRENKVQRNLEFSIGLNKGKDENLNVVTAGIKYALINQRDKSVINFLDYAEFKDNIIEMINARHKAVSEYRETLISEQEKKQLREAEEKFHDSGDMGVFPEDVRELYKKYAREKAYPVLLASATQKIYDTLAKRIDQKPLLTVSFNPGFDVKYHRFDSTAFSLRFLRGFGGNPFKPWNLDMVAIQLFQQDTNNLRSRLSRSVFITTLGVNKVLLFDGKYNPLIELEIAYEMDYIENGRYVNEDRDQPKLVNTLRIHISKEVSLPLTAKYDLKHPNIFGIFRFQWDMKGIK